MSFAAPIGSILKFSWFFVKIQRWVLVKMSFNCKLAGLNGKLPANFKLKKGRETMHRPNWFTQWKRKLLVLWLLGLFITGGIWVFLSFSDGTEQTSVSCGGAARILLEHFNVSKSHLQASASPFSESDQGFWR